jgi:beta-lactamase regulating signal transducer with metallopeptidase domain
MSGAEAVLDQLVDVGAAVWRASWQASVLAVLVVAVQLIFGNRIAARWRHAMWMLVLVRLALPVVPSSPVSVFNLAPVTASEPAPVLDVDRATIAWTTDAAVETALPLDAPRIESSWVAKPQAAEPVASRDLWAGWSQVLATVWAAGAVLLALRIAWATWRVSRTLRKLHLVDDAAVHDVLRATAAELRVRRLPLLLAGDGLFSPALVGFVRPKLLVPRDLLDTFDPAELRLIFLHELAHLKRRDVAINWAATVLTVLHWLNPIAWLVVWRLRLERELACDELVMSRTSDTDRRAYGHTIVKLLETFSRSGAGGAMAQPLPAGGVGILEGKAQMKRRITMIAKFARSSRAWTVVAALIVIVLGAVALTDAVVQAEEPAKPATRPAGGQKTIKMADGTLVPTNGPEKLEQQTILVNGDVIPTNEYLARREIYEHELRNRLEQLRTEHADSHLGENHPAAQVRAKQIATLEGELDTLRARRKATSTQPTKLKAGDLVTVSIMDLVAQGVETVKTARIDGDGTISLPYTGAVKAAGLSPRELETAVAKAYLDKGVIENAVVAVSMPERGESHQIARVRGAMTEVAAAATPFTALDFQDPALMEDSARRGIPAPAPTVPASGTREAMIMEDPVAMDMAAPAALALAPAAEWDEATKAMMTRKVPELKLDSVPFADVVDALRDLTSSNIFVNWRALEAAGIDRNVPVTLRLRDVAFKDVLSLVLRNVGGGTTYKVENGVIVIDAPNQPAKAPKLTTKTYDVRNLLTGEITEQTTKAQMNELQRVVITTVQPATWQRGGSGIAAFDSRLIVTAPDDVHKEVAQLLKMLQRDVAKPTTNPAKGSGTETGF